MLVLEETHLGVAAALGGFGRNNTLDVGKAKTFCLAGEIPVVLTPASHLCFGDSVVGFSERRCVEEVWWHVRDAI